MPSDKELYLEANTEYAHLSQADSAKALAKKYELNYDSVRGRLSRASRVISIRTALRKHLAHNPPTLPPSVQLQQDIVNDSWKVFNQWSSVDEDRVGVFVSDMHAPYTRFDAYELLLNVLASLRPHAITALNDSMDNKGYGKHDDNDAVYRQLWRSDFANSTRLLSGIHADFRSTLRKDGKLLGLLGNHDAWWYSFQRNNDPQTAEAKIAQFMSHLYEDDKVLLFSRGENEPILEMSEGLAWVHGLSATSNPNTLAKKGFQRFMSEGRSMSWVQGHTHRPVQIDGKTVGYNGVTFTNSGHLRNDDPRWLKHPQYNWGMAIVVNEYNPTKWASKSHLVHFVEERDMLVARYKGHEWAVKIDKKQPY